MYLLTIIKIHYFKTLHLCSQHCEQSQAFCNNVNKYNYFLTVFKIHNVIN